MQIRLYVSLKVQKTLQFHDLGDLEKSSVVCFSETACANLKNGGSRRAFIIFLLGTISMPPSNGHQGN